MIKSNWKKWLPPVAAVLLALVVLAISLLPKTGKTKYDIVFLGDSVVGNIWDNSGTTGIIERRMNMTVYNGAFGGTSMSFQNDLLRGSKASSLWCMAYLARAICYDDWGGQLSSVAYADHYQDTNTQALDYFRQRMEGLSQIDFDRVKILFIEHGTNDYNNGRPLDNPEDPCDITTFGGALRSSLTLLQEHYPDLRIILVTPVYCELGENGEKKCYNTDYGGGYLDDYVALEKEIAAEYGVEVIDAYHESGIWEENAKDYLLDMLHLSAKGHEQLGNFIADYLEETQE